MVSPAIKWRPYRGGSIRLTAKERSRADGGWTIVVRPQKDGTWMVAAISLDTGKPFGDKVPYVSDRENIQQAARQELRMLSKMSMGGDMADASRMRPIEKEFKEDRPEDDLILYLSEDVLTCASTGEFTEEAIEDVFVAMMEAYEISPEELEEVIEEFVEEDVLDERLVLKKMKRKLRGAEEDPESEPEPEPEPKSKAKKMKRGLRGKEQEPDKKLKAAEKEPGEDEKKEPEDKKDGGLMQMLKHALIGAVKKIYKQPDKAGEIIKRGVKRAGKKAVKHLARKGMKMVFGKWIKTGKGGAKKPDPSKKPVTPQQKAKKEEPKEESVGLAEEVRGILDGTNLDEAKYADVHIPVTMKVTWRGMPVPKRQPMWISDLSGKSERSKLKTKEMSSSFYGKKVGDVVSSAGLARMMGFAEKAMASRSHDDPAHLVQVTISVKVPSEISKVFAPRSGDYVMIAKWDAWRKKWTAGDNYGAEEKRDRLIKMLSEGILDEGRRSASVQAKKDFVRQAQERQGIVRMPRINKDEYPPIRGMEGPFQFRGGRILYYDPRQGRYYDRKTDMYLSRGENPGR